MRTNQSILALAAATIMSVNLNAQVDSNSDSMRVTLPEGGSLIKGGQAGTFIKSGLTPDTIPDKEVRWSGKSYYDYMREHLEYPAEAANRQLTAVLEANFLLDTNGSLRNITFEETEGTYVLFHDQAKKFLENTKGHWIPGIKAGKAVAMNHSVPVDFGIIFNKAAEHNPRNSDMRYYLPDGTVYFSKATYKGGINALYQFVGQNVNYPEEAIEEGAEGQVILRFVIEKDSSISNIRIVSKRVGSGCDEEAIRVLKLTDGNWEPAYQRGQPVRMQFALPVRFNLESGSKSTKKEKKKDKKKRKNKR